MRLNVQEAARLLNVSTKTIYRWAGDGRIPGYRVHKQYRFDRTELLEWARAQHMAVPSPAELAVESPEPPLPTFAQALEGGGIHYRVGGDTREEVLRSAVLALRLVEEADREMLAQALVAREALAPTSIGDGFALPHLRNPLALQIGKPAIGLCYLDRPADWGAPDGEPVSVLLIVVGPTVRSILRLHIEAWYALRDPVFRAAVVEHAPREVILAEAHRVTAGLRRPAAPEPA